MNNKFYELPEEKQLRIINAGFEVFSQSEYKHASTEQIAAKADISKGLLFYYFHDKKTLYMFLFEYASNLVKQFVVDEHIGEITDFFELCQYASERKCQMLRQTPYITDFIMRGFYSQKEDVSDAMNKRVLDATGEIFTSYFSKIDFSKFRDDVKPHDVYQMLSWMADGYLHERQRAGIAIELDDIMEKYKLWSSYLKRISYKEEYLQ